MLWHAFESSACRVSGWFLLHADMSDMILLLLSRVSSFKSRIMALRGNTNIHWSLVIYWTHFEILWNTWIDRQPVQGWVHLTCTPKSIMSYVIICHIPFLSSYSRPLASKMPGPKYLRPPEFDKKFQDNTTGIYSVLIMWGTELNLIHVKLSRLLLKDRITSARATCATRRLTNQTTLSRMSMHVLETNE